MAKCKHGVTAETCWLCKGHKSEEQGRGKRNTVEVMEREEGLTLYRNNRGGGGCGGRKGNPFWDEDMNKEMRKKNK